MGERAKENLASGAQYVKESASSAADKAKETAYGATEKAKEAMGTSGHTTTRNQGSSLSYQGPQSTAEGGLTSSSPAGLYSTGDKPTTVLGTSGVTSASPMGATAQPRYIGENPTTHQTTTSYYPEAKGQHSHELGDPYNTRGATVTTMSAEQARQEYDTTPAAAGQPQPLSGGDKLKEKVKEGARKVKAVFTPHGHKDSETTKEREQHHGARTENPAAPF